jgi:SET domain-containing protein
LKLNILNTCSSLCSPFNQRWSIYLASYVPLESSEYSFLDHDSYASTYQSFAPNREWLHHDPIGSISEEKMLEINFQMIRTYGLQNAVRMIAEELYHTRIEAAVGDKSEDRDGSA